MQIRLQIAIIRTSAFTKLRVDDGAAARDPDDVPGLDEPDIFGKDKAESSFFVLRKYLPTDEEKF